jgi:serine/threonine protein kinase
MSTTHYCANCLTTFVDDMTVCSNLGCRSRRPNQGWGLLLGEGDLLDRNYRVTRALAVGGAGLTYLARELDDAGAPQPPDLAIKVLYTSRANGSFLRRLANEAQILQELQHPNIVNCHGFVQRSGKEPYLVTKFEEGGSLAEHLERHGALPADVSADITKQILSALDVAHQRGVVHRDLKPDNVLIRAKVARDVVPHCLVTDFGIAKVEGGLNSKLTKMGAFVGTPEYAAPEQFEAKPPSPATDVFAAGGVLFHCLMGRVPVRFANRSDIETAYGELLDQIPPQLTLDHPHRATLQGCLDGMMDVVADKRWTIHQVLRELDKVIGHVPAPLLGTMEVTGRPAPGRLRTPNVVSPQGLLEGGESTYTVDDVPRNVVAHDDVIAELIERNTPHPVKGRARAPGSTPPPPPAVEAAPPAPVHIVEELDQAHPVEAGSSGGCLGLSVVALLVVGLGGGVLTAGALGAAAAAFGWFSTPSPRVVMLPEVVIDTAVPQPLPSTDKAWNAEWKLLTSAVQEHRGGIAKACKVKGLVLASLRVEGDGTVTDANVEDGWLKKGAPCVAKELGSLTLPREKKGPAQLSVALRLD